MFTGTLSDNAQNALALLGKKRCLPKDTYLAGGSALALHFGHRVSVDFDFFTPNQFNSENMVKSLIELGKFQVMERDKNTLLGLFEKVKFSLFLYEYPLVGETTSFVDIAIVSTDDIAAMKLAAIMNRGTKKDYVDLYFLAKNGITIDKVLDLYDKKYKALANNLYSIITSLSYFDDAEKTDMPEMLIKTDWKVVRSFFEKEVVRLGKKYL